MTAGVVGLGSLHSPSVKTALAQSTAPPTVGWPQYQVNSGRSGVVADRHVPTSNVTPKWPLKKQNVGRPVADGDTIYVTSETLTRENPQLQAISRADGSVRWQTSLTDDTLASGRNIPPAVIDGMVYFSNGTRTRAFDAETGTEQWNRPHGGTWLVVSNDRLYLQGYNDTFVTLDGSDGSVVWEGLSGGNRKSPTWKHAVADETLYVGLIERSGDAPSEVRALDSTTGTLQWKTTIDADYPEVAATKQGVIVATNTVLYSLDPVSGTIRWQQEGGPLQLGEARYVSTPVIHEDMVYATVDDTLFAFNIETGTKQWTADGISEITLVGTRLYGMRGSTFVGLDVSTGQQQTEYRYSGEGRIDMIVPLDGMLLTRLYRYFDDPQDQWSRIGGSPSSFCPKTSPGPPRTTIRMLLMKRPKHRHKHLRARPPRRHFTPERTRQHKRRRLQPARTRAHRRPRRPKRPLPPRHSRPNRPRPKQRPQPRPQSAPHHPRTRRQLMALVLVCCPPLQPSVSGCGALAVTSNITRRNVWSRAVPPVM
ncbi:PQQ-binding-like beta-propeller repeat protein [Halocatena marina]